MPADLLGNDVTAGDAATLAGIHDFVGGMLSYETRAVNIIAVADAAPGHCLAQVYAGMIRLLAETSGAAVDAAANIAAAQTAAASANPREALNLKAAQAWAAGDLDRAIALFEAIVTQWPRDLLALKMLHYHLFNRGDSPAMLRVALAAAKAAPEVAYVHGMAAFGYEQCHLLDDAEREARHALELNAKEPWAQHALAHVMLTQGRIDEGARFMEEVQPTWTDLNSFMITHLWWHLALFRLSQGRNEEALAIYDDQVWAVAKDYSQDQVGAVSLLTQLGFAGIDVGGRWDALGAYLKARADDVVQPFLSVQYLYGLARAGLPQADTLLAAIADQQGGAWRDVALPLARGLVAHARGDHRTAVAEIDAALPRLVRLGGSHAQRDLFAQILLDAEIRAGDLIEAQQTLEARRAHDPDGVALNRQLADVYQRLGLTDQAHQAQARVERRLAA
jgi:tetratricopeptide (TPR) repeat protein